MVCPVFGPVMLSCDVSCGVCLLNGLPMIPDCRLFMTESNMNGIA